MRDRGHGERVLLVPGGEKGWTEEPRGGLGEQQARGEDRATDYGVRCVAGEAGSRARNRPREGQVLHKNLVIKLGVISLCWRLSCERPPSSLGFGRAHLGSPGGRSRRPGSEQRKVARGWPCWSADSAGLGRGDNSRELAAILQPPTRPLATVDCTTGRSSTLHSSARMVALGGKMRSEPRPDSCPLCNLPMSCPCGAIPGDGTCPKLLELLPVLEPHARPWIVSRDRNAPAPVTATAPAPAQARVSGGIRIRLDPSKFETHLQAPAPRLS